MDFHEILYLKVFFSKICRENSSLIEIWKEWRVLCLKTYLHLWYYLAEFSNEKCFRQNCTEKETHFVFNNVIA